MKYYLLAALALVLSNCKSDPIECHSTSDAPIVTVAGPKTIAVNQPATFTLSYKPTAGCGTLAAVSNDAIGTNTRQVAVSVRYDCTCNTAATTMQTTYTFQPTQAGTYYLRFAAGGSYIADTLVAR